MFKFVTYEKVEEEFTTLEFRGGDESVDVNHFDGVVSLEGDEAAIDALVEAQETKINCQYITQDAFRDLVKDHRKINLIRDMVAKDIAKQYSLADEIGMLKREETDPKRVAYEAYVAECKAKGDEAKAKMGY